MKPFQLSAALLFVGAILLTSGSFAKSWIVADSDGIQFHAGLREAELCEGDQPCHTMSFEGAADNPSGDYVVMVWAGRFCYSLGLAAALAAFVCGILFLAQDKKHGAVVVLGLGIACLIGAIVFLVAISKDLPGQASRGLAPYLYFAGAGSMTVAGALVLRGKRLISAGLAATTAAPGPLPSTAARPIPACPQCSAPMSWVTDHQRFYCHRCRVYV